jgi:glyoxylase-like metal-dependent hydrolase (beta-lactamase superfamily II)
MVDHTSARVLIHEGDTPWLRAGRVPTSGRSGVVAHIADTLPLLHWTPVEPDDHVTDGEVVDGLRVIHTPGHSPGHIALLHEPSNPLLVGDALFHRTPEVALRPDAFAADPTECDQTLRRLPLDVAAVGFAHGAPLSGGEVDTLAAFIARQAH